VTRLTAFIRRLRRDERGVAAVEMALIGSLFCVALLNAVDVGRYAYLRTEVATATQIGAQAALVACDPAHLPATVNCPELNGAVATAIHGTSLGSGVGLSGAVAEAYYCLNASGVLTYAADLDHKPADCGAFGVAAAKPVLYLRLNTTYAYVSLFGTLSVAKTFPATITRSAWMRMS
jgi:Flp pilus assembly protein TadG